MTETPNKFSVMELADAVGVPRTTINDWLTRYERFVDFRLQGKRKVYTAATLAVLQEIGELRNAGLSSFDIEEALAKRHPVRAEVAELADGDQDLHPVLHHQVSEMADLLRQSLLDIQRRLDAFDQRQQQSVARARLWIVMTVLVTVLLVFAGVAAAIKLQHALENSRRLAEERRQAHQALRQAETELGRQIAREHRLADNLLLTRDELAKREREFVERLETMRQEADSARAAALLAQRDEFAQGRLELLRQIDAARENEQRLAPLLRQLQEQLDAQNEAIRRLGETPPAPAAAPADLPPAEETPPPTTTTGQ